MGVEMTICPDCGKQNLPGADLCESCSHDLTYLDHERETVPIQKRITQDAISSLSLRPPVVVEPRTRVVDVLQQMRGQKVGAVVVRKGEQIVGIFTERDYLYRIVLHDADLKALTIESVMTPSPAIVSLSHSLAFALREMAMGRYRHLPVMDEQHQCIGILSADGILRYLVDHLEE